MKWKRTFSTSSAVYILKHDTSCVAALFPVANGRLFVQKKWGFKVRFITLLLALALGLVVAATYSPYSFNGVIDSYALNANTCSTMYFPDDMLRCVRFWVC